MATKKDEAEKSGFLTYKNRPLVRCGNTLYYGDPSENFIVMIQILTTKELDGITIADKLSVQLINNDPEARPHDRIAQKTEKKGLFNAMDIGSIWLERALAE